jgi:hypothetical protein
MTHAIVLQPPPGDLTGPRGPLPYLKASAQKIGFEVRVHDLGIESFRFLTQTEHLEHLAEKADAMRLELEAKGVLQPNEQRLYGLLLMAKGYGLKPSLLGEAAAVLRDEKTFYDYPRYRMAARLVEGFYRLLRAVHYPTLTTPSKYPTAQELRTMERIRSHLGPAANPYADYYEQDLFPRIGAESPALVGISMDSASQSVQAIVLGMLLKARFPDIHVAMTGAYVTQWGMLMDDLRLSAFFACTDSIVCGEPEAPFPALLGRVIAGKSLEDLPNVLYRDGDRILRCKKMVHADLADQPPPDFSDLDLSAYLTPEPILPYDLTRGCYWQRCAFCQMGMQGATPRPYQAVPLEKAIAELSALAEQYGCNHFHFDVDVIDAEYLKSFAEGILDGGYAFSWNANLRMEEAFTPDLCRLLAKAGLNSAFLGLESGCQASLDAMEKGTSTRTASSCLRNLYHAGVATRVTGFLGFPGESERDALMTERFLMNHLDWISGFDVGLLMVLPGSAGCSRDWSSWKEPTS